MRPVIWSDPHGDVYPPALAAFGFDLTKTFLLRTARDADESWAVAECLRCRGVGAVIAAASPSRKMSRIEARRLQLAAERGGSVGILLRPTGRGDDIYAAATRWKVSPCPGERTVQRWTIQLLHGHGGRVGETVFLEWRRETNSVHTLEKLSRRPAAAPAAERRATA
jgi:protein ImuA